MYRESYYSLSIPYISPFSLIEIKDNKNFVLWGTIVTRLSIIVQAIIVTN